MNDTTLANEIRQRIAALKAQLLGLQVWLAELERTEDTNPSETPQEPKGAPLQSAPETAQTAIVGKSQPKRRSPSLRIAIMEIYKSAEQPLTIQEVADRLKERGRSFHKQTPYSTIARLAKAGKLVALGNGSYESGIAETADSSRPEVKHSPTE